MEQETRNVFKFMVTKFRGKGFIWRLKIRWWYNIKMDVTITDSKNVNLTELTLISAYCWRFENAVMNSCVARFEVLTAGKIYILIFWFLSLCSI